MYLKEKGRERNTTNTTPTTTQSHIYIQININPYSLHSFILIIKKILNKHEGEKKIGRRYGFW